MEIQLPLSHRPNIKTFLYFDGIAWAGCRQGLYRFTERGSSFLEEWRGQSVIALGASADGVLVVTIDHKGPAIWRCDREGRPLGRLPDLPEGDKPLSMREWHGVWAGGERGLYLLTDTGWVQAAAEYAPAHVPRLEVHGDTLVVCLAKYDGGRPAVLTSRDGVSWSLAWRGEPGGDLKAATPDRILTKWGIPADAAGELPVLAAWHGANGERGYVRGTTLVYQPAEGSARTFTTSELGRTLWLEIDQGIAWCCGEQGVFQLNLDTGAMRDLAADAEGPSLAGRVKRFFHLGGDRFLINTTFGSFITADGGQSWQIPDGAENLLHVRRQSIGKDGACYLATQDAVFVSRDEGRSWAVVPGSASDPAIGKFSGIAAAGDRLLVAGKHGAFVAPIEQAGARQRIEAIGDREVSEMVVMPDGKVLIMAGKTTLYTWDPSTGECTLKQELPRPGKHLYWTGNAVLVAGKDQLLSIRGEHVEALPLPEGLAELNFSVAGEDILAWDTRAAWLRRGNGAWVRVVAWPPSDEKPGAILAPGARYLLATDCRRLFRFDLSEEG